MPKASKKGATKTSPPKKTVVKRTTKAGKDPNAPKRPASAFMIWLNANRPKFQGEGIPITEVSKMAGAEWRKMTDKEKTPWQKKAEDAKAQYEKDKAAYENGAE